MPDNIKRALFRFLRGAVASAIATMIPLLPSNLADIGDLDHWLVSLGIAGFIGFISGGLLALDKMFRDAKQE